MRIETMLYYGVSESRHSNHVKEFDLRETAKFLIHDETGSKFKKVEGEEYLATNSSYANWTWSGYNIYPIDHEKPKEIIEKNKRSMVAFKIRKAAKEKIQELNYSQCVELAKFLNIEID